jgi:hypothetical protein
VSEAGPSSRSTRVYAATAAGQQSATKAAIAAIAAISDATQLRPPRLVGLANLPLLTDRQVTAALNERHQQLDQRIRSIDATRRAQQPLPPFVESIRVHSASCRQKGSGSRRRALQVHAMTQKIDFKKQLDSYKAGRHAFRIIEVPPLQYLMVDGHGDPNISQEFADAAAVLYPVAFKLKFASKQDLGKDYVVMPLEGLWWADDMETFTSLRDKSRWNWTLMIMVPAWVTQDMFRAAVAKAAAGVTKQFISRSTRVG